MKDTSGNGFHGVAINGAVTVPGGKFSRAGDYTASNNQAVSISSSTDLEPALFTITAWVKADNVPSGDRYGIYHSGDRGNFTRFWIVANGGSNDGEFAGKLGIVFAIRDGGPWICAGDANNIAANTWYFCVGTYDGTIARIYVNAVLEGSRTYAIPFSNETISGTGAYFSGLNPIILFWDGVIDEVALYDRCMTPGEIENIYYSNARAFE